MSDRQKILIVDDSEAGLFALEQVLRNVDAEVIEADSGESALAATQEHDFAVAIVDVLMPGMSGFELAAHLRADERTRFISIIFLTGFRVEEESKFEGYEAGGVDFIIKPYSPQELVSKVKALLEIDRHQHELQEHGDQLEALVAERTAALQGRVREMRYLYALTSLVAQPCESLDQALQAAVDLIPSGCQRADAACARVTFEGRQFATANFQDTPWKQSSEITVSGRPVGTVEVGFVEDPAEGPESPFLKEGRELIEDTARQLGVLIRRTQAEAALERSEAQLSNALQMARAGHWEYDVARDVFTFNDNFYRIFRTTAAEMGGYEMSSAEYARKFCHPDDAHLVAQETRAALETTDPDYSRQLEHRILYADGEAGYISVRFFVVKDVRGRTVKTYGVNQDITERKRAEESLRLFRTLIDHSSEAIEVLDPETGRILDANQRAWTDTGYTREEFLSLNIGEIDPYIDDFSDYRARLEHLRETGAADMESVHRRKDGTTFPVEINLAYVRLDRDYIVTVVRDITARRQAEAEYRTILRTARDGFWLVDAAGRFLDVNEAYCQLVGYSRDELLRMAIQDIEAEETPKETKARMKKIIAEGSDRFETRHRARDGRVVDVEISVNYMDVGEGRCFVFIRDITGRKQMEEERDRLQSQLLQAQKMEAVGRLAGGVAHDFNNLLMGIRGFAGFARDSAEAGSQAHKDLTEALALADRAATLTRQLLAFSRRQALAPIALDLNGLIQAQANMLTRLLGEDIELRFLPASDLGSVRADPGQIEQVIMNLAVNARDAMPEGGSLTIETANVDLGPQYARDHEEVAPGPYVLLAITDSGLGMDAATRAQLFEPFFTTKELGKGTGLGLSTVYGIVKQHGGHIWVYSEPGSGTTFKVYLPRVAMDAEEPAPKSDFVVGGDETILLVEDSDAVRDVGRRHLESLGYKVLCAAGPREAEEVAQKHKGQIDLLLTDVVMPERGGRELYEAMAAHRTGLKVLYMSGYTDDAIVHRGVLEKGVAFLQKPFERDDLADKVRQALEA